MSQELTPQEETCSETFAFQAEISQLMSLIINTFYSNKDIFLRELISNSSDALDKIRYLSLTQTDLLSDNSNLNIEIIPNKDAKTLTIRDSGVGMTRDDLINNLGTIARSGTKAFIQAMESGDKSLIGQFGVGFYSAYLVADRVSVTSKNTEDSSYRWDSNAEGSFTISQIETDLKRGTEIVLHMKEDQMEYLEESKLREIITRHSEFINYPILLLCNRERDVKVENENEETVDEENQEGKVTEVDETQENNDREEIRKEVYQEFEELNKNKPIWTRNQKEVTEEEYKSFYKSYTNDWDDYLTMKHFSVEGQLEFSSLLFIPKRAPFDLFDNNTKRKNLKLYVRRVFITDECNDLIPEYFSFIRGIVDSQDLPLNISREMLQKSRMMQIIRKNVVKKCFEMLNELSESNEHYLEFYKNFSKNIKLGIHEDTTNRDKLVNLLRYNSFNSGDELISLQNYIDNMPENQTDIYYIIGDDVNALRNSSFVEGITNRGYDVILMAEAIDEYCIQQVNEFKEHKLICITRDNFTLPETDEEKELFKNQQQEYESVCQKIKEILSEKVESVSLSSNLVNSPCCIVTSSHGWSANMERIMKAQALRDNSNMGFMSSKKHLQINPRHPIVNNIRERLSNDTNDNSINSLVLLLYDTSLLTSGFTLEDPNNFAQRMYNIVQLGLGIEDNLESVNLETENLDSSNDSSDDYKSYSNQEELISQLEEETSNNLLEQVD